MLIASEISEPRPEFSFMRFHREEAQESSWVLLSEKRSECKLKVSPRKKVISAGSLKNKIEERKFKCILVRGVLNYAKGETDGANEPRSEPLF